MKRKLYICEKCSECTINKNNETKWNSVDFIKKTWSTKTLNLFEKPPTIIGCAIEHRDAFKRKYIKISGATAKNWKKLDVPFSCVRKLELEYIIYYDKPFSID